MITVEQAFQEIKRAVSPLETESVELGDAVGRILAEDLTSDVDSPPHDKSVMDGFAIRCDDYREGGDPFPIAETIVAGGVPRGPLPAGQVARIMTGAPLPEGADAVVMIEMAKISEDGTHVRFDAGELSPGKHLLRRAAIFAQGDQVFTRGQRLTAWHVGLLAETGHAQVPVFRRPALGVLPTGDELVDCRTVPGPGQIRNSNGPMLLALARQLGLEVHDLGVGRDNPTDLRERIEAGLEQDLLVLSGGVSAGMLDLVPQILAELEVVQRFHKVRVKPGKPIWFGCRERAGRSPTWVFGLPGNPVSSLVGFELFVRMAIRCLEGAGAVDPLRFPAVLTRDHATRGDRPTFWPGRLVPAETPERRVEPLDWRGSSDLRALGQADALIHFPVREPAYRAGEQVEVLPLGSGR